MDERLIDLKNKVLDKALDKVFNMAQGYIDKVEEEEDGCAGSYEEALEVVQIHLIMRLNDVLADFKDVTNVCNKGILESLVKPSMNSKHDDRVADYDRLVDVNNVLAEQMENLIVRVLGEEQLQNISTQIQIDEML